MRWRRAVRGMQGDDPLSPVAIVVPTNTAGVMARRALGRRGGFAAIDVLTPFRLAELLGAPSLHAEGRRPVSTPVVDLAVRRVVHDNPGLYAGVQHHQSTIVALRDLYRELRHAGAGSITALARTGRGSEPARVAAEVARSLRTGWYDEGDLLGRAVERAAADLPARLRRVVVHLPQRLRPLELELLATIGEHGAPSRSCSASPATPPPTPTSRRSRRRSPADRSRCDRSRPAAPRTARDRVDDGRRRRGAHRRPRHRRRRPRRHAVRPHRRALPDRAALRPPRRAPPRRRRRAVERPARHPGRRADGAAGARRAARPRPARAAPQQPHDAARRRAAATRRRRRVVPTRDGGSASDAPPVSCAKPTGRRTSPASPPTCARADRWDAGGRRRRRRRPAGVRRDAARRARRPAGHAVVGRVGELVEGRPRALVRRRRARPRSTAPSGRHGS